METIFQWSRIDNAPLSPSLSLIEFREHTGKWNIRDQIYITILIGKVEGTNKSVSHETTNPIQFFSSLPFLFPEDSWFREVDDAGRQTTEDPFLAYFMREHAPKTWKTCRKLGLSLLSIRFHRKFRTWVTRLFWHYISYTRHDEYPSPLLFFHERKKGKEEEEKVERRLYADGSFHAGFVIRGEKVFSETRESHCCNGH